MAIINEMPLPQRGYTATGQGRLTFTKDPAWFSSALLRLTDGKLRALTGTLNLDAETDGTAASGIGSLDTGNWSAETWHYIYLVPDAADDDLLDIICSTTPPYGVGPTGYTGAWRYVGATYYYADGTYREVRQTGNMFTTVYHAGMITIRRWAEILGPSNSSWSSYSIDAALTSATFYIQFHWDLKSNTSVGHHITFTTAPSAPPANPSSSTFPYRAYQIGFSDNGSNSFEMPFFKDNAYVYARSHPNWAAALVWGGIYLTGWRDAYIPER